MSLDSPNPNLQQMHHALGAAMFKAGFAHDPAEVYRIVEHLCDEYGQPRVFEDIIKDAPYVGP